MDKRPPPSYDQIMTVGSPYKDACALLADPERERWMTELSIWSTDGEWSYIATNITSETALSAIDLHSLLVEFLRRLADGSPTREAWPAACWAHQLRGAAVPAAHRPPVLGRAMPAQEYADRIFEAPDSELPNRAAAQRFLREHADRPALTARHERTLRRALLGRHVIWATFNLSSPDSNPFHGLPRTTAAVRTALGLGHLLITEPLVLLAYRSDRPDANWRLYRPTVADAEMGPYYRPHGDPNHPHGWTCPLDPNPEGLAPQPELVHDALTGVGLLLPYHLT